MDSFIHIIRVLKRTGLMSPRIKQRIAEWTEPMCGQGVKVWIFCEPEQMGQTDVEVVNAWDTQYFLLGDLDGNFDPPNHIFGSKINKQVAALLDPRRVEMEDWDGHTVALVYAYNPELVRAMQSLSWTELCPSCWSNLNRTRYISEDDPDMDMCGKCGWELDPKLPRDVEGVGE